jgi:hypothetical protein
MHLEFDFQTSGDSQPDPFLNEESLERLFANTRAELEDAITRKLGEMTCAEHNQAPAVLVRAIYDRDIEQMDISYSVEACCSPFMLRVVQVLHRIG